MGRETVRDSAENDSVPPMGRKAERVISVLVALVIVLAAALALALVAAVALGLVWMSSVLAHWTGLSAGHLLAAILTVSAVTLVTLQLGKVAREVREVQVWVRALVARREDELDALEELIERAENGDSSERPADTDEGKVRPLRPRRRQR